MSILEIIELLNKYAKSIDFRFGKLIFIIQDGVIVRIIEEKSIAINK